MEKYGGVELKILYSWSRHYMEVSGQLHARSFHLRGKGSQSRSGEEQNLFPLSGAEPRPSRP
jgi:hypothetical protein